MREAENAAMRGSRKVRSLHTFPISSDGLAVSHAPLSVYALYNVTPSRVIRCPSRVTPGIFLRNRGQHFWAKIHQSSEGKN